MFLPSSLPSLDPERTDMAEYPALKLEEKVSHGSRGAPGTQPHFEGHGVDK